VGDVRLDRAAGLSYRECLPAAPEGAPVALGLHGWPTSSYMWRHVLQALAGAGYRAIAPDLPGFGDSPPLRPGTWEQQVDAVARFHGELELGPVLLVVHDWGGLIGLRWACDNPDSVSALAITDTGFFADGEWHGLAQVFRTPDTGEEIMSSITPDAFRDLMKKTSEAIPDDALDEYAKTVADWERKEATLALYRSGDFEKLEPYKGRLGQLGVPTLIVWGERDPFAPVGGAYRFLKEMPHARLVVLEDAGHWLMEDDPERVAGEIGQFAEELRASSTSVRTPNPEAPDPT
jgi:haloalkane dehalogenase